MTRKKKIPRSMAAFAVVVAVVCAATLLPAATAVAQEPPHQAEATDRALLAGVTTCAKGLCRFTATKAATKQVGAFMPLLAPALAHLKKVCPMLGLTIGGIACESIVWFVSGIYNYSAKMIKLAVSHSQCFYIRYVKWGWIPFEIGWTSQNCS